MVKLIFKMQIKGISIVIPARNEETGIAQTLTSLQKQTYKNKVEIIVVDNLSSDNTASIARSFGVLVLTEPRKGIAYARQTGALASRGDIIISTDADTIHPSNWVESIVSEFDKDPNIIAISGLFDFYDGSRSLKIVTRILSHTLFTIFNLHSGCNMAIEKSAFQKIGGFNTKAKLLEDCEIMRRLGKIGKIKRVPYIRVKTSARRFNQLGIIGGVWNYGSNYLKMRVLKMDHRVKFQSGSEVLPLSIFQRGFIYAFLIMIFLLGLIQIQPVRAEIKNGAPISTVRVYSQLFLQSMYQHLAIKHVKKHGE